MRVNVWTKGCDRTGRDAVFTHNNPFNIIMAGNVNIDQVLPGCYVGFNFKLCTLWIVLPSMYVAVAASIGRIVIVSGFSWRAQFTVNSIRGVEHWAPCVTRENRKPMPIVCEYKYDRFNSLIYAFLWRALGRRSEIKRNAKTSSSETGIIPSYRWRITSLEA